MEIRPIDRDELGAFHRTMALAFGFESRPEGVAALGQVLEPERTLAVFDGSTMVGTAGAFPLQVTVPGGSLSMAGTTVVSILPTHRRRGLLRRMMARHLEDAREWGESLAGLWASESSIYRRFGYGAAAPRLELTIDKRRLSLEAPPVGAVRLLGDEEVQISLPAVYEECRPERAGMLSRTKAWWGRRLLDPEWERGGMSPFRFAVYENEGRALGYAQYRQQLDWADGNPAGKVDVVELMAVTPSAYRALWSFLLGIDLSPTLSAWNRPVDEPLPWMVDDPRRIRQARFDALWLRPLDVSVTLAGRRYASAGTLVLEVIDSFGVTGNGTYRLEGGPDGAGCVRCSGEPDLRMEIADLGAIFLGGVAPSLLAAAGRIEGGAAALRIADRMFGWTPAPWCPEVF